MNVGLNSIAAQGPPFDEAWAEEASPACRSAFISRSSRDFVARSTQSAAAQSAIICRIARFNAGRWLRVMFQTIVGSTR